MSDKKKRTYDAALNVAPNMRLEVHDATQRAELRARRECLTTRKVESFENGEDLVNRLIEAIKSL